MTDLTNNETESRPHNSRFAKAGVLCFYESEVLNSSFVNLMKFSAEKRKPVGATLKRHLQEQK